MSFVLQIESKTLNQNTNFGLYDITNLLHYGCPNASLEVVGVFVGLIFKKKKPKTKWGKKLSFLVFKK